MKEAVYIETSVVSYFTSQPSQDIIVLAHQEITRQWWPKAVQRFDVFISEVVLKKPVQVTLGLPKSDWRS